jgi:malonyl-CoA/methylmalonyl-CoA synthetase
MRQHPAITECAVVGLPDDEWGERVALAAEVRAGRSLALPDLQSWAKPLLANYKLPRELRCVDALPRNAMGKIVKPRVAALFAPEGDR